MSDVFEVRLARVQGYQFRAEFDAPGMAALLTDEPPPLGAGAGPNPARLLAAAVGNCLAASLLFCLSRARVEVRGLHATVRGTLVRNERQRLRIGGLEAVLAVDADAAQRPQLERCLELFEDFCVVTASVRQGVPVAVRVEDAAGAVLRAGSAA